MLDANIPRCLCAAGYSGKLCQHNTDDCSPNPCRNGGSCVDGVASFTCVCAATWTGSDCGIDACTTIGCGSNEVCVRKSNTSVACSCSSGYYRLNATCIPDPMLPTVNATTLSLADFSFSGLSFVTLPLTQPLLLGHISSLFARVGINGYVSLSERPVYFTYPRTRPNFPIIFPMWTSRNVMKMGPDSRISYEVLSDPGTDNWVTASNIVSTFTGSSFTAAEIVIVTWRRMQISSYYSWYYSTRCSRYCGKVSWCKDDSCVYCQYCPSDHVSFQLAMARNSSHSFLALNFGESVLQRRSSLYFLSGFSDAVSEPQLQAFGGSRVPAANMPNRLTGNVGVVGRFVTTAAENFPATDADACADWLRRHATGVPLRCGTCPTNHRQALADWRYGLFSFACGARSAAVACYRGPAQCVLRRGAACLLRQRPQCCYELPLDADSALGWLRSALCELRSRTLWQLPLQFRRYRVGGSLLHRIAAGAAAVHISGSWTEEEEQLGHRQCVRAGMFSQLSAARPPCSSDAYRPIRWGRTRGDPHFTTLDGRLFTFNGHCEYVLVENATSDVSLLQVQARTDLAVVPDTNRSSNATVFTGFAMRLGANNESIAVLLNRTAADMQLFVDSRLLGAVRSQIGDNLTAIGTYTIATANDSVLISDSDTGVSINVSVAVNFLQAALQLPPEFQGNVRGLLGNFNGDTSDDLQLRNGSVLSPNATERQVFEFGQSWRIADTQQSHFPYFGATSRSDFCNAAFVPVFVTDFAGREAAMFSNASLFVLANQTCWNPQQELYLSCLYDAALMESLPAAEAAVRSSVEAKEAEVAASNSAPNFTMPSSINVTAGATFRISVVVADPDGDNITLSVSTSLPNTTVFIEGSDLVWHVASFNTSTSPNVSVVATDSRGAESEWRPVVLLCDCLHGANCSYAPADAAGKSLVFAHCSCPDGYQGSRCEVTPCDVTPSVCYVNASCRLSSNGSFSCDPCPAGMAGDGRTCIDANPCSSGTAGCEQQCRTLNSTHFACSCGTGYTVSPTNSSSCIDIDECSAGSHSCKAAQNQTCVNTVGSYSCSCTEGARLNAAGDCEFVDVCATSASNPCGANSICVSTRPGFSCVCDFGFSRVAGVCVSLRTTAPPVTQRISTTVTVIIVTASVVATVAAATVAVLLLLRCRTQSQKPKMTERKVFDAEATPQQFSAGAAASSKQEAGYGASSVFERYY